MSELITINELPAIPESWDYDSSLNKQKERQGIITNWVDITKEYLDELYVARALLSKTGVKSTDPRWGNITTLNTWSSYCDELGLKKNTVNGWLRRYYKSLQTDQSKQDKEDIAESLQDKEQSEQAPADESMVIGVEKGWYKIGNQFLYCGSNLDDDFLGFLPDCKFAFADPPYNAGVGDWDKDFVWQQDFLQDVAEVVAVTPGGWNAYGFYRQTEMQYAWEMACWIKNGMTHGRYGFANFIKASIFSKGKPKITQDVWEITIKTSETEDSTFKGRKPYPFMIHLIDMFSQKGDCVVDPFAGSGTTLLVAEEMNRISYNAELQEKQCIEIINRAIKRGMHYERI